ncbi:flavin-dependent dehydrogenase [Humibacillus xanthopallidus]|uniref:Flavin-dependent dehydrogenase n=1 Tax=Humibacillus xanthopallidus TaxID=412689 RepID=A0A543PUA8_9MICO|nr:FAD-dependent monooxygenase [Humibacillus xanthopallidus]TQN47640.1 flavin-dependent dehydrogenase [Humibacillus xanthopallidus]
MTVLEVDVVVVGGGPAGASLATSLATRMATRSGATHRVLVIDRGTPGRERGPSRPGLGETLPGAAARLLRELGVWDGFVAQGHPPCHARLSRWGSPELLVQDALRDLDGAGWSIDRTAFDDLLLAGARSRGAVVRSGRARVVGHDEGAWRLHIGTRGATSREEVRARFLVDATGRGSRLLGPVGQRRTVVDRLVCVWTLLPLRHTAQGTSYVESAADGWWFTAPVPGDGRLLAFHTDPEVVDVAALRGALGQRAAASVGMSEQLRDSRLDEGTTARVCASGASRMGTVAGPDWLAIGDAAMSFDPLSSQGLFHALYTGLTSADAVGRALVGDAGAIAVTAHSVEPVWSAYRETARHIYASELRWADQPFWRARHQRMSVAC